VPEPAVPAHKGSHELVGRCPEDLLGGGVLRQFAADGEDCHLVAQHGGLVDVVGDKDDGLGQVPLQPQELLLQFVADHRDPRR
jgi:hypothetical protein